MYIKNRREFENYIKIKNPEITQGLIVFIFLTF